MVFGHWPPSEGTPARLVGATHILVSSPAVTAVGKVSAPQQLSVVAGGEEEEEADKSKPMRKDGAPETVGGRKGEEEDGPQGKLEDVEEVGGQGEKVLVSTTEEDVGSVETQLDIGERSEELAEAEPSKVACSEPLVVASAEASKDRVEPLVVASAEASKDRVEPLVVASAEASKDRVEPLVVASAEASKDRVEPHHQVKTAWEEGAKTPPSDHETATTTSQHADRRPGVMEILDIEIIDPHAANHTQSEARSPGSKLPNSNPLDSNPLDSNPLDSNPLDSNPLDSNPLDSNPLDSNPLDSNPLDSRPPDSKSVDSKHLDSRHLDSRPSDSKPLDSKPLDSNPPNSKPLDSDKARQEGNGEEEKFWTSAGSLMPQVSRL